MSKIETVKILADLIEPGEEILHDGEVSTITGIKRLVKRLRVRVELTLDNGETVTLGGSKFVEKTIKAAA